MHHAVAFVESGIQRYRRFRLNASRSSYLATWRWLKSFTPDADAAVLAFFDARRAAAFRVVETQLAGRAFLLGTKPCIADISMQGYLHFPAEEWPLELAAYPNISGWIARFRTMPGWKPPYELIPGARFPRP